MRFTLNYELICEIKMLVDMILNFTYQTATMRVRWGAENMLGNFIIV